MLSSKIQVYSVQPLSGVDSLITGVVPEVISRVGLST